MVSIGSLSWTVQVQNAAQAKKSAQDIEDSVKGAKESMEEADEQTGGLKEKLGGLSKIQETAGKGFDKMNAKAGFFGTALSFVTGAITTIIGSLFSLEALLLGGVLAALVALAIAWKENIGDIQGRVAGFKEFIIEQFNAVKATALNIWNRFLSGFKAGGGDIKDLKTIFIGVLDGLEAGLKAFWSMFQPLWSGFVGVIVQAARPIGKVVGGIVNWLAKMERESKMITKIVAWVTALVAVFATAWAIVEVVTAIVGVFISLISIAGSVLSALATLISIIGTVISVMSTVISVVGAVIAALNPVTLIILAIVAVIIALYVAWETNFLGIRDIVDNVINFITQKFNQVVGAIRSAIDSVGQIINNFISGAASFGSELIDNIVSGITGAAGDLTDTVSGVVDDVRSYLPFSPAEKGPLAALDQVGPGFIGEITSGIQANAGAVKDAVADVAGEVREYLPFSPAQTGPLSDLNKTGPGFVNTVAQGIKDKSPELADAAKTAAESAKRGFNDNPPVAPEEAAQRSPGRRGGEGQTMKKIEINVGGVDIGDQSLDIRNMSRSELQRLAEQIATALGDDVRSTIS